MCINALQRDGTVCPPAGYDGFEIWNLTNNVEPIKYLTKIPNKFLHQSSFCVFKTSSFHYPSWRRYTFLSHLTTKSKISVRWIKKLVAVTGGVDVFTQKILYLHSYNCSVFKIIYANVRVVAPGTVCPGAIYQAYTI